jgi:hypothetical protein
MEGLLSQCSDMRNHVTHADERRDSIPR